MATGCHGTRRSARTVQERRRVLGLAECLLFGRAVDRLYLRSGLSSWPCSIWMAKRNEARWRFPPSHGGAAAATHRGIYNRALFILYWAAYVHREIRGERAACVPTVVDTLDRDLERLLCGRKHANVDDERIISVKGSLGSWINYSDENTRFRERNLIYFKILKLMNQFFYPRYKCEDQYSSSKPSVSVRVTRELRFHSVRREAEFLYSLFLSRGIHPRIRSLSRTRRLSCEYLRT